MQSARASIFVSASVCAVASFTAIATLIQLSEDTKVKGSHNTTLTKGSFPLRMAMADDLSSIENGFIIESDEDEHDGSDDEEGAGAPITVVV